MSDNKLKYSKIDQPVRAGDRIVVEFTVPESNLTIPIGRWDAVIQQLVEQGQGKIEKANP